MNFTIPNSPRSTTLFHIACCISFILWFSVSRSSAQTSDAFSKVRVDWHLAMIAEDKGDVNNAIAYYHQVIEDCLPLPLDVREWFQGCTNIGIAHDAALLRDTALARTSLEQSLLRHFWNVALIERDTLLIAVYGKSRFDSLVTYWNDVYQDERPRWQPQQPIVLSPSAIDSNTALLIAMDGGNGCYEEFSLYWRMIAQDVNAIIVIPPGVERISQIVNSWESDFNRIEPYVVSITQQMMQKYSIPSSRVYLTGFSQGAQAAIDLTLLRPSLFRGAIAFSGFSAPVSDSVLSVAARYPIRIYAISGREEAPQFASQIRAIYEQCTHAGIPFTLDIIPGMTHEVPLDFQSQFLKAWQWVRESGEAVPGGH